MNDIGEYIDRLRLARGWTWDQLSVYARLPLSTLSAWKSFHITPSLYSLEKICGAFGISLSQFFAGNTDSYIASPADRAFLREWNRLDSSQQKALLFFLKLTTAKKGPPVYAAVK